MNQPEKPPAAIRQVWFISSARYGTARIRAIRLPLCMGLAAFSPNRYSLICQTMSVATEPFVVPCLPTYSAVICRTGPTRRNGQIRTEPSDRTAGRWTVNTVTDIFINLYVKINGYYLSGYCLVRYCATQSVASTAPHRQMPPNRIVVSMSSGAVCSRQVDCARSPRWIRQRP